MNIRNDISSDFVRREARASEVEHRSAMRSLSETVARLFGEAHEPAMAKADLATGGLNRRRFIQIGGITVASAAVFAACGTDDSAKAAGDQDDAKSDKKDVSQNDIKILRTASSLEILAVEVYTRAMDTGLVKTAAVIDATKLFQGHHKEHADLFEGATKKLGGKPMEDPNPVLLQAMEEPLKALTDETSVIELALMLEQAAAATYQKSAGQFKDLSLNTAVMSVGGVEARHVAVLSSVLGRPGAPKAFQTTDGAIAAGTGV